MPVAMPVNNPQAQRKTSLLKAWFVPLDEEKRNLLQSGRFRLLLLFAALLLLLLLNLPRLGGHLEHCAPRPKERHRPRARPFMMEKDRAAACARP